MSNSWITEPEVNGPVDRAQLFAHALRRLGIQALRQSELWEQLDDFGRAMLLDGYSPPELDELRKLSES
ncbi:hypothetical protein GC167_08450 [bacterium]|nr:hypothetical protein [bacterium]